MNWDFKYKLQSPFFGALVEGAEVVVFNLPVLGFSVVTGAAVVLDVFIVRYMQIKNYAIGCVFLN